MAGKQVYGVPRAIARKKPASNSISDLWTQDEDDLLRYHVLRSGPYPHWCDIVAYFPGRMAKQLSARWHYVLNPSLVKGSWTREEDQVIMDHVARFGQTNWAALAATLPGRLGKQCRERWVNHLDPDHNYATWTATEDAMVLVLQREYGNQWGKIASLMKGRSENQIKNRWNSHIRPTQSAAPGSISHVRKPDVVSLSRPVPTVVFLGVSVAPRLVPMSQGNPLVSETPPPGPRAGSSAGISGGEALTSSPEIGAPAEIDAFFAALAPMDKN
jgi:hypothetical protein